MMGRNVHIYIINLENWVSSQHASIRERIIAIEKTRMNNFLVKLVSRIRKYYLYHTCYKAIKN